MVPSLRPRASHRRGPPRRADECRAAAGRAGPGAVRLRGRPPRLRPDQPRRDHADRGARARADQQPDRPAAERGADADERGAQPREPAVLVARRPAGLGRAHPGSARRGATARLRCRRHRSRLQRSVRACRWLRRS